jgi:hypothetical protein
LLFLRSSLLKKELPAFGAFRVFRPSVADYFLQPVSSKSERQSYKLRTLENYQHGLPILPLSVEVCTPVSETGRAGALPAVAAIFIFDLRLPICDLKTKQQRTNTSVK